MDKVYFWSAMTSSKDELFTVTKELSGTKLSFTIIGRPDRIAEGIFFKWVYSWLSSSPEAKMGPRRSESGVPVFSG